MPNIKQSKPSIPGYLPVAEGSSGENKQIQVH